MVLRCNRTFVLGIDVIMPISVALMLLCIGCRTFSVGTDVIMPMYGCTDVTVQYVYFGSWSIRTCGLAFDVVLPLGFSDVFESTGYICILLLQFQFRDSEQYSIPYVWEIVFSYVLVQGGVVDPDKHGFLDGSCHIVLFSAKDLEIVHWCYMATDVLVVVYWRRCLQVLFESLSKGSPRLSYIFFIAANLPTTITVDDTALVGHFIFVLRWHKDVFECPVSFKIYSHTMLLANVFNTFTNSWYIRNNYVVSL